MPDLPAIRNAIWTAKDEKYLEARFAAVRDANAEARDAFFGIQGKDSTGAHEVSFVTRLAKEKESKALFQTRPDIREAIFAAIFPGIAKEAEAACKVIQRLPYTRGYDRRGFRSPRKPERYGDAILAFATSLWDGFSHLPPDFATPEWIAAHAAHFPGYGYGYLGSLLAGCLDLGNREVFDILKDSAGGQHAIGIFGTHIPRAMLASESPEAWDFLEKTLLAAQRNEGLRQSILEAADESHPDAFIRFVRVIIDNGLVRFSSVARAMSVWAGDFQSALTPAKLKQRIERQYELLTDDAEREKAIAKGDALDCHTALWCVAFRDVDKAIEKAAPILADKKAPRRLAAARLLRQSSVKEARPLLLTLLEDKEPEIALESLEGLDGFDRERGIGDFRRPLPAGCPADIFDRLEKVLVVMPDKPKELKPLVPEWPAGDVCKQPFARAMLEAIEEKHVARMLPHLRWVGDYQHAEFLKQFRKDVEQFPAMRTHMFAAAGHRNSTIHQAALDVIENLKLAAGEATVLEEILTRTSQVRVAVLTALAKQPDEAVLASVDRLLASKNSQQRLGGIELARRMIESKRVRDAAWERLQQFRASRPKLAKDEAAALLKILEPVPDSERLSLQNCLGLIDPADLTPPAVPSKRGIVLQTPAAVAFLKQLDAFIHENREARFTLSNANAAVEEQILGSIRWSWMFPGPHILKDRPDPREAMPLYDLFEGWWKDRPSETRDADGFELLRARAVQLGQAREGEEEKPEEEFSVTVSETYQEKGDDGELRTVQRTPQEIEGMKSSTLLYREAKAVLYRRVGLRYKEIVETLLAWFLKLHAPSCAAEYLLDAAEESLAVYREMHQKVADASKRLGVPVAMSTRNTLFNERLDQAALFSTTHPEAWTSDHTLRLYGLLCFWDRPRPDVVRQRPAWPLFLEAYHAGKANEADVIDQLIGAKNEKNESRALFPALEAATKRDGLEPKLLAIVDRVVERILEIELARGEEPTVCTVAAVSITRLEGMQHAFRLLKAFGKRDFSRQTFFYETNHKYTPTQTFSILLRRVRPSPEDAPEAFAKQAAELVKAGDLTIDRLVQFAFLNPRWCLHVEAAVGWKGFDEALWWMIVHSSNIYSIRQFFDEENWQKADEKFLQLVKARSRLTAEQRAEGMVDVAWFHQAYKAVGNAKRWDAIEAASKFLSDGQGNKKALRLADVLLGVTKKKELVTGIQQRNLKEFVALLGLLPLPADMAKKDAEIADRYKVLKTYERYAKGLSSLSKEPALQAARLGLSNLATTAELGDPMRLEWAVSGKAVAGLLDGPVEVKVKDVTVRLALNHLAEPEIDQSKAGKPLKSVPPDVKKNPKVAELFDWKKDLQRMSASTLKSLEQAMCAGEPFTAAEIQSLMGHALVKPLLERLVLKGDGILGYPVKGGKGLRDHKGKVEPVKAKETLTLAHPLDLLEAGDWADWQKECFAVERLQPFKQVFREVYVPTKEERKAPESRRYAGQQVNPTQALALFGNRGWSVKDGVDKRFRTAGIVAEVYFNSGATTPAEMECPTLEYVRFHKIGSWDAVPLKDVPAVVFSEVMRDLDLVVSVAHAGGVDPEASASTVEMRSALLKETFGLLGIKNVKIDKHHVTIAGDLGKYSVHLGSGVVHKLPGGSLCIVPVHSQHRGRLFLPFADNDPKTAEVVSKILLLARDKEIQDPTILDQIAAR